MIHTTLTKDNSNPRESLIAILCTATWAKEQLEPHM